MEPQYYKDRLGFSEPPPARNGRHSLDRRDRERQTNGVAVAAQLQYETNVGYEENLSKFKGMSAAARPGRLAGWELAPPSGPASGLARVQGEAGVVREPV